MGSLTPAEIELIGKLPDDVARGLLWHAEWMDKALDHQLVPAGDWWSLWLLLAGRGAGKALALDTPLPTPAGWTTMGEVEAGDTLFDEQGRPCRVLEAHPVMVDRPCYRVTFSDGSEIIADGEHLWRTETRKARKAARRCTGTGDPRKPQCQPASHRNTFTTDEIRASLMDGREINHAVRVCLPLELPEQQLPIHPYVLGAWLGDGSSACGEITTADPEVLEEIQRCGETIGRSRETGNASRTHAISPAKALWIPGKSGCQPNSASLTHRLGKLGVLRDKHVPASYLRASAEQRLALLQGLMDTDGYVSDGGIAEFCTTKRPLADAVFDLVSSLGMKATLREGRATLQGRDCGPKYRVNFTPYAPVFRLPRKLARVKAGDGSQTDRQRRRYIVAVEPVPSVPVRCVTVDSPSRLYLCGRAMIPTHNTRTSAETIGWWAWSMPGTRWLVSAPTYGDLVGTCFEGESGLLAVIPHELIEPTSSGALYNKTDVELRLKNGSLIKGISAENPERFRGPQFHGGWCLPGDTMIATPTGPRRLDEIRVGDVVCTRFGPRRVLAAGRSNNKNDVVTIECGDTSLTATVDHPILVNDRWVPAGEIVEGDFLCCTASSMTGSPGISVPAGTFTTSGAATCIATSGSKSTEPSLPVTSSITLTATPATTTSSTFSSCASPSTNATTALGAAQAKRTKLQQLLRWTASAFRRAARAFIAQKYSYQSSPAPLAGSVLASAARSGDATSLPPSSVPASCAQLPTSPKSGFNATAARSATTAPPCEPIALKKLAVTSVVRSPNIPTFNLTVEGEHEFIANGVVVHNCDELAAWQRADEAFDMIMFGMRLGDRPRIVISTTPKPKPIITRLIKREGKDVTVSRASTYANLANLAPTFREQILQYEGTALGRQEIHAEVLDPADQGIIKRSWIQLWPADKPLPVFDLIVLSLDTAFTEATRNSKTGDADFTGCSVWGLFREERQDGVLLLDCWQERLGMPDLIERTKREMAVQYGDRDKPLITPIYGAPLLGTSGRKPDLCVIEDKGSGISLRQMLAREGLSAVAYNPGRASKLERLHMVSHLFANGMVWVVESDKRPGQPRSWADPLIEQICSFSGEKSIAHDDLVDSSTQALRVIVDKMGVSVANPREIDEYWQPSRRRGNPYAA